MANSNKRFTDMKTNVCNLIQDTSADMKTKVGVYLNAKLRELVERVGSRTRYDYSFSTTSGTQDYAMPDDFLKSLSVYDGTNKKNLTQITQKEYQQKYESDLTSTGSPDYYIITEDCVRTQPSSAGVVVAVSSSASDTSQTIYIRGIVSGVEQVESITLTGTTNATGSKSFSRILSISKSAVTVGYVTVTRSDTLSILAPEVLVSRYKKLRLVRVPGATLSIEVKYLAQHSQLVNDYDYPLIDVCDILELGATADAWRYKRQFGKASHYDTLFEKGIAEFLFNEDNTPDMTHMFRPQAYPRDTV